MKAHIPRKRFGQNFLVDQQVVSAIIAAINPRHDDCIVEIGPGLGALTKPLTGQLAHLHVVEIDRDIVAYLKSHYLPERLTIHESDALSFNFLSIPCIDSAKLRVVGNLPYNISTPLLFHLAHFAKNVKDMTFMLQKEVVDRMVAKRASSDYGRLSVMLQYRFVIDALFDVSPDAFNPAPRVNSTVVRLIPKPESELIAINEHRLSELVRTAFSQRRKMLRNTLKGVADENQLQQLGISSSARAEEVSVEDYVFLSNHLCRS